MEDFFFNLAVLRKNINEKLQKNQAKSDPELASFTLSLVLSVAELIPVLCSFLLLTLLWVM